MDDLFADFDEKRTNSEIPANENAPQNSSPNLTNEFEKDLKTRRRDFKFELKKSRNGKFLKITENSRARRSVIMMDIEDIASFTEILCEVQSKI